MVVTKFIERLPAFLPAYFGYHQFNIFPSFLKEEIKKLQSEKKNIAPFRQNVIEVMKSYEIANIFSAIECSLTLNDDEGDPLYLDSNNDRTLLSLAVLLCEVLSGAHVVIHTLDTGFEYSYYKLIYSNRLPSLASNISFYNYGKDAQARASRQASFEIYKHDGR